MKNAILKLLGLQYSYPSVKKELTIFVQQYQKTIEYSKSIDIIMPTFNRLRETKRTLEHLYKSTLVPFNLIIVDSNSSNDTVAYLKSFEKQKQNVTLVLLEKNEGGAGARIAGLKYATSGYVAFLDNDILVMPGYFENLISTLEENKDVLAVQSKVVFPNKLIQINRPYIESDDEWIVFYDKDIGKEYDSKNSLIQEHCDWIPIGATIWRREIFNEYSLDVNLGTSFEDNDFSYRLHNKGYKFLNCPSAICLHITSLFAPDDSIDQKYTKERFGDSKVQKSARIFFQKHGLIFSYGDPKEYIKTIGFKSIEEYVNFVKS